jgi:hypothetical protein
MSSPLQAQTCSQCGSPSDNFVAIDGNIRTAMKEAGSTKELPDQICASCFESLTGNVSQGLKLRMERDVREKNKMMMWKSRVTLIKNARNLMNQKAYSEAAVQYEKYLKVLEMVYGLKKGELSPAVFNNSSRSKELTVVASVYWDLLRIYDTHPKYAQHMIKAASKLAQFLPISPIYPDIVKKADEFSRSAKNPTVVRQFLKMTKSKKAPCFIADAAFAQTPEAAELTILRDYRDQVLLCSKAGRRLVWTYYKISPPLAAWIGRSQLKSAWTRWLLTKMTGHLKKSLKTP